MARDRDPDAAVAPPLGEAAARSGLMRRSTRTGVAARWALSAAGALVLMFFALVALYAVVDPLSTLMIARLGVGRPVERLPARLAEVAPAAVAAIIASEDATFCANDGVDWGALHEVLAEAGANGPSRGASTITMQTAKNLFLWPGRSVLRKGLEIPMALVLGKLWPKRRVIEVYLNIAEWGDGVFGIGAAAERYFHKRASALTAREGALLATALPNPEKRDPAHPQAFQRRRAAVIMARAAAEAEALNCL